jgi:hypothetical protein
MKKRRSSTAPTAAPPRQARAVAVAAPAPVPAVADPSSTAPMCFGVSLLVALAATLPAFTGVVDGSTTLVTAAARFLTVAAVAFALAQVLVFVFPRRQASPAADRTGAEPVPADR